MGNKQHFHNDKVTQERYQKEQQRKEAGLEEEYAGEISPSLRPLEKAEEDINTAVPSRRVGYAAIILAFVSLFIFPAIFGPAAAVLGAYAWIRGNKALGAWSIILGLIALAAYFLLFPLYA